MLRNRRKDSEKKHQTKKPHFLPSLHATPTSLLPVPPPSSSSNQRDPSKGRRKHYTTIGKPTQTLPFKNDSEPIILLGAMKLTKQLPRPTSDPETSEIRSNVREITSSL